MSALHLSTFANKFDNEPRAVVKTWSELVESLRSVRRTKCTTADCIGKNCPHKDGRLWSPAVYPAGATRADDNVVSLSLVSIDNDHLTDEQVSELAGRVQHYRCIIHATHTDRPNDRALRTVLATSRSVTRAEWPRFWAGLTTMLELPGVDSSRRDLSGMYYLPSRPSDAKYLFHAQDGEALDVDAVLATVPEPEPAAPNPSARFYTPKPGDFSIDDFMSERYPGVQCVDNHGVRRWDIECPWQHEHSGKSESKRATSVSCDAMGRPGFKCMHSHCDGRKWQDFRKWHQPDWTPYEERSSHDEIGERRKRKHAGVGVEPGEQSHPGFGDRGGYRLTDLGNAKRFADMHAHWLRYVPAWKKWLTWDGKRWRRDDLSSEARAAREVAAARYADAAACAQRAAVAVNSGDSTFAGAPLEELNKWAKATAKRAGIENMIALARSEPEIATGNDVFDRDPMLLNVANGTIDLRTGELRPHRQSDMITMLADIEYDPTATAPEWERFLGEVLPDAEVRAWIHRLLGYALTGDVREQVFPFWIGKGGNGKNVCADAVASVMGDYATTGAPDLLVEKRDTHPTELADLEGKRLVLCSEIEQGRSWAEARIKQLTGDKTFKARGMRENFHSIPATAKLIVFANTKPKVRSTDDGIWRRLQMVPWTVQIPKGRQDRQLLARLIANEAPGILAWLVRGCLAWQESGLGSARAITVATAAYRQEEDVLGLWIADCCQLGVDCREESQALYRSYTTWCESEGIKEPWAQKTWRARLLERDGILDGRSNSSRGLKGIALVTPVTLGGRFAG